MKSDRDNYLEHDSMNNSTFKRGRPIKPRTLTFTPPYTAFAPLDHGFRPMLNNLPIYMTLDEIEAYKLVYYDGLTQEDAAKKMGISRGTLWRLLDSARRKIAIAIVESRPIIVIRSL